MKETKCTIIQDILPLYVDEVVSQDTKEMVKEHLQHCERCRTEYESMKRNFSIPMESDIAPLKAINKKWRKKKVMITLVSIFATAGILFGAFAYAFYYEKVIPYSEELVKIERDENNQLVSRYYGKSYATVHETSPMLVEVDGERKNVSFIFYTKTMTDGPARNLINMEKISAENGYAFNIVESEKVDAIYYANFDTKQITSGTETWEEIVKRAELIWEE